MALDIYMEICTIIKLDRLRITLANNLNLNTEGGETGSTEVKKLKLHAEVLAAR